MPTGRQFPYRGALANDGTGDPLRTAMETIAATTAELYDAAALQRAQTLVSRTVTAKPSTPALGAAYLVPTGATGDWSGQIGKLAVYEGDSGWVYLTPANGHRAWVVDEGVEIVRTSGSFVDARTVNSAGQTAASFAAAALSVLATITPVENSFAYFNSDTSAAVAPISAAGRAFVALPNLVDMRASLGLGPTSVVSFGQLRIGASDDVDGISGFNGSVQAHHTGYGGAVVSRWSADAGGPGYHGAKSRGAAVGTRGIVQAGDVLNEVVGAGDDGAAFLPAGAVRVLVSSAPATGQMPGAVAILTTGSGGGGLVERARVDHAGRVLVGYTAAIATGGGTPTLQTHGVTASASAISATIWGSLATGTDVSINKSRSGVVGTFGIVQQNDVIGAFVFRADDGTAFVSAASVQGIVTGVPAAGDMAGALVLRTTPAGAAATVERVRVTSAGFVGVGTSSPAAILEIAQSLGTTLRISATKNDAAWSGGQVLGAVEFWSADATAPGAGVKAAVRAVNDNGFAGWPNIGLAFHTATGVANDIEQWRMDSSGRFLRGLTAALTGGLASASLQVAGVGSASLMVSANFANDATGGGLFIAKSRSGTAGALGGNTVLSGDSLGAVTFLVDANSSWVAGASISAEAEADVPSTSAPTRLVLSTRPTGAFGANVERVRVNSGGNVGIGGIEPTAMLDVNSNTIRVRTARTPSSAGATGNAGDVCWDASYVYVCVATNTWKRAAIATW